MRSSPSNAGVSTTSVAMIARFQNSGAIAGTAKWSKLFRTPTTSPERPSSSTIGNSSCARWTVRSVSCSSKPGANSGMITGASSTNSAVRTPSDDRDHEHERGGDPERLRAAALLELLGEDRHERRLQRRVGEQAADQVRDLERDRERAHRPLHAEVARRHDLADEAGDPREPGREREERGRERQPPGARSARPARVRVGHGARASRRAERPAAVGAAILAPPPCRR